MEKKITFRTIWHEAGISGLVLAAVCSAEFLANNALATMQATWASILAFIVQLAKIAVCIKLMHLYMTRFKISHGGASRSDLYRFGLTAGVLSALVIAALNMAYYMWNPEIVKTAIDTAVGAMASALDRNTVSALEAVEANFPQIAFFSVFIYCSLWALILPAILAPGIISSNPFDEEPDGQDTDEQDTNI